MDPELFEMTALPLFESLYNLAHWLTGERTDAEDLVQETYAKALKGIRSFEEGTNLRAWMFRIMRNVFLTSRTGLKVQKTASLDEEGGDAEMPSHTVTPESIVLQLESSQVVFDALAELPLSYREIVLLCDVEELSYKEIAEVLAVPIGTVMSRLSRARTMLRQALSVPPARRSPHAM